MQKSPIINYLKGYSISTIVIMHLMAMLGLSGVLAKIASFGGAGAHIYILCSGFGLYLSHLNKPLTYKSFLCRRFSRIYLPMAVFCLVNAIWMAYNGLDWLMPLLGNVLLFKMFVPNLETSMGEQMWFISTIIQFYIAWPLIIKLFRTRYGGVYSIIISLLWATLIALLGFGEERILNSFFLQFLWEFYLGMWLADVYYRNPKALKIPSWRRLITISLICIPLAGIMGIMGMPWKLYNDIPSLFGYLSLALIIYKLGIKPFNKFLEWINGFSYELFLVHIMISQIVMHICREAVPVFLEFGICLSASYITAIAYSKLLRKHHIFNSPYNRGCKEKYS